MNLHGIHFMGPHGEICNLIINGNAQRETKYLSKANSFK